jgi:hypothetical protein
MTNGVTQTGESIEAQLKGGSLKKRKTKKAKDQKTEDHKAEDSARGFSQALSSVAFSCWSHSSDVNHLVFFEPLYKRADAAARALFIHVESLACASHQIVEHYGLTFFDLLPQGRARAIQSVVEECVQVQQDCSPIVERREDG